jgi:glycosyltransferase involved in cell wall biosynthesis
MRILVIQETDWITRGPHTQHHLMDRMALKGHEIRVIDYEYLWKKNSNGKFFTDRKTYKAAYRTLKNSNITLIEPGMFKFPGLVMLSILYFHTKEIKKQISEFKPNVIIGFGILNSYIGVHCAKKSNIPFIYYLLDQLHSLLPNRIFQKMAKQFEQMNIINAYRVLVLNQGLKDYVRDMGGDLSRVSIITSGVDIDKFNPQIDGLSLRERYGIKKDDILLFFMGWIYDFSGIKEVVESLSITNIEKVKLMIVGDGDLYEPLLKIRSEKKLDGKLILTGKVPFEEIPKHIAAADICLLPAYKNEIMMNIVPIKIYEYMAMGKPIIATNLPGIRKEFGLNNGISYIEKSAEALEKSLWLDNTNRIKMEGEKAYSFVQDLSWDNITDKFENLLANIILKNQMKQTFCEY